MLSCLSKIEAFRDLWGSSDKILYCVKLCICRFSLNDYVSEIDQTLKEGLQLRSNTLQLIRAAFDDEVTVEEINNFRTLLHRTQVRCFN